LKKESEEKDEERKRRNKRQFRSLPAKEDGKTHQYDFSSGNEVPTETAARMAAPSRSWTCWCLLRRSLLASFHCCEKHGGSTAEGQSPVAKEGRSQDREERTNRRMLLEKVARKRDQHDAFFRLGSRNRERRTQRCLVKQVEWR
jgi:hypothetical protein